jgi:hypothetical protein
MNVLCAYGEINLGLLAPNKLKGIDLSAHRIDPNDLTSFREAEYVVLRIDKIDQGRCRTTRPTAQRRRRDYK